MTSARLESRSIWRVDGGGPRLDVLDGETLDGRAVEEVLLEGIHVAGAGEDDVPLGQRGVEARFEAQAGQAQAGGDRDRHPAQHAAQRGLRRVEVAVGVDEHEPDAQGRRGRPRVLQSAEHAHERAAIGEEPDREAAGLDLGGDDLREMAVGQAQPVPLAVRLLLLRVERDGRRRPHRPPLLLEELLQPALLEILGRVRELGDVPLAAIRHLDQGDGPARS